ncbi:MAG: hypothetical protein M4579_000804 [Chaenotheca gracillima]|nr:MAG: hypothetical protein M4579_000804 [Chaenotheca gracillima]
MSHNKYSSQGPPPAYPEQAYTQQHYDAGPVPPHSASPAPGPYYQSPPAGANADYYGGGGAQPQNYYGYPPQQGPYAQPQGMYYQQQPQRPPHGAPAGYYADDRDRGRGGGLGGGLCAAVMSMLACCCCLDFIF